MKLVAEPDQTQLAILEQLKVTQNLLAPGCRVSRAKVSRSAPGYAGHRRLQVAR